LKQNKPKPTLTSHKWSVVSNPKHDEHNGGDQEARTEAKEEEEEQAYYLPTSHPPPHVGNYASNLACQNIAIIN